MKTYSVCIKWNHLGSRYPISTHGRFKASSMRVAVGKALKDVKKANGKSWREPRAATFRIDVIVVGDNGKEADDGGRTEIQQHKES